MGKQELDIFKKGLPSHLKGVGLDEATKKLMGKTARGSKRISIKGSVFRMIVNGEETAVSEERSQNWIVVAVSDDVQRVFFEGTYKEGQTVSPRCWSENSKMPDPNVPEPVSKSCESCPNNVQGSSSTGGRACRFSMRVAIMLENDPTHSIYQVVLPSVSIFGNGEHYKWPFRAYGKYLGLNGVSISLVVTKASFDIKSPTPKLTFAPVREVTAEEYEVIKNKYEAEETVKATKLNIMPSENKPKTIADNSDEPVLKAKKETGEKPQSASDIAKKWANE